MIERRLDSEKTRASRTVVKVAYLMSRFPKLTETFILYEMMAMEDNAVEVELYPLLKEKSTVMHPEARPFVERAHFQPFFSWPILWAQLQCFWHKPGAYLHTLWTLLRANWGSVRFLAGALAFFPKALYFGQMMRSQGVSHIHAHFASHPAAAAYVIHQLADIPYSFTAHGSDLHRDRHMLVEKVAGAAFVVAISAYNRELILNECGRHWGHKVIVIHCGVDTTLFQPRSEPLSSNGHSVASQPFVMLCVGTLHEVKGQTYLIESCRLLRARGIAVACHLVGDGPDRPALLAQVERAGLSNYVTFHGQQPQAEVIKLLHKADVLVLPSVPSQDGRREGIPVVLMEAMAAGLPVIASRLSGIPELVNDEQCGLLTPPGDVAALADALQTLHDNPALRRQLGWAGRQKVICEFDLSTNAAVLAERIKAEGGCLWA